MEDLFVRFSSMARTAKIYPPDNIVFKLQIKPLFFLLRNILDNFGKAVFFFCGNALFFNTIRIQLNFNSYQKFQFLSDEFKNNGIETVGFRPGLKEDELERFIVIFAKTRERQRRFFEHFLAELRRERINNIYIEKIHPYNQEAFMTSDQIRQSAKKIFFKSITHLKEVLQKEKSRSKPPLKTTRRLVQSMINILSHDESFMMGLTNIKNFKEYTLNHSTNVAVLALCLGKRLGLEERELVELGLSAFFHDIGTLDIPKKILEKEGRLNEEERAIVEKHPRLGLVKLLKLKEFTHLPVRALAVALEHHIGADLSGYPRYWKKGDTDLYSKIVKICDFFDAVTTKRSYRDLVFTREEALVMMLDKSGREFDPFLLQAFIKMVGVYPIGTLVALSTGEMGIVAEIKPEEAFVLRPRVKLISDENENKINGQIVDLTEKDSKTGEFKRTIVKTLDHQKYNINVADYFIAQTETLSS